MGKQSHQKNQLQKMSLQVEKTKSEYKSSNNHCVAENDHN